MFDPGPVFRARVPDIKPDIVSHFVSVERRGKYYLSKDLRYYVLVNKHQMLIYQHSATGP